MRGRLKVLAIKENAYELCPWADLAYGCDFAWWKHRRGLERFPGLKIGWDKRIASNFPDVKTIEIREVGPKKYVNDLLFDRCGEVGSGGNSGFQALNLVLQFGARRVLLVGFDMHDRSGSHWYGRNYWWGGNNPDQNCFDQWMSAFNRCVPVLKSIGADVVNASPISKLDCFRKRTVEQALRDWEL